MAYRDFAIQTHIEFYTWKGSYLEGDNSLAIVKVEIGSRHKYSIIDVASGLYIMGDKTKTLLLKKWATEKAEMLPRIEAARKTDTYQQRVEACQKYRNEKGIHYGRDNLSSSH